MPRKTGRKHRALEAAKHHERLRALGIRPPRKQEPKLVKQKGRNYPGDPTNFHEEIGFVVPKKDFRRWDTKTRHHAFPTQWYERPGICGCGCGNKTKLVKNPNGDGNRFNRFIAGHQWLLRRRLFKPAGWKSSYEIQREYEDVRHKLVVAANDLTQDGKVVATFAQLRSRIDPIVNGRRINNQGISRMIHIGRWGYNSPQLVTARSFKPVAPISDFYPFTITSSSDDLLQAVNRLVPHQWHRSRADICQDILLAILSGECRLDDVPARLQGFRNAYFKRFGHKGHMIVSMDDAITEDGSTLHEILSIKDDMTNLASGGMNWDVQQGRFELVESNDICARY